MAEPMTEQEFAAKVEWEGGPEGALEYGLRSSVLPDGPLKEAWSRLEDIWDDHFADALSEVEDLLADLEEEA